LIRRSATVSAALLALLLLAADALAANPQAPVARDYDEHLRALYEHFHANPELSHREYETAARLAGIFRELGYEVTEGIGGTGVAAVLDNGPGPTVMLRADMDGLPIEEKSGLPYASTARQVGIDEVEHPVMHACGHDVHMTALVGAARYLAADRDGWSGTLVLVAQPAEERLSGAAAMLDDGLYERVGKPDYALAFHISSTLPAGEIQVRSGITRSSMDNVDIVVHGVGGHGASPHLAVDPVMIASQIIITIQSSISRSIAPQDPVVVTVGSIHGGSKHNIISDRVDLQMTVRSDDPETRQRVLEIIDEVADGVARSFGVPDDKLPLVLRSKTESTPPTINDAETADRIRSAFAAYFGPGRIVEVPRRGMGAEDFARFVEPGLGVRGVYFQVGGAPIDELDVPPHHHSAFFRIEPEPSIRTGTEAMIVGAHTLMPPR
jgi:hippurate hydrolase